MRSLWQIRIQRDKNPKRFFKYIKRKRVTTERILPLKDQCGHLCVEAQEIGEAFSQYFLSAFTLEKVMKVKETESDVLGYIHITSEEVLAVLCW